MQQQVMQMQQPIMAAPFNITTDHIQQYLDENKALILKIIENQSTGKHAECAENQARLQHNLMYLAAIADSQPQPSSIYSQSTNYLQHHQQSQQSVMATQSPILYGQQQSYPMLQQRHQSLQSGIDIADLSSRVHMLQSEENSANGAKHEGNGSQNSA